MEKAAAPRSPAGGHRLASPPSGTITFLFTDIEGSTRLWEHHTAPMKAALARHDELLRRCIEAARGYVFKTVGDAFCAAFETAVDAMSAALDSQAALQSAPWEVPGGIRVRMALHAGTAEERDGDYFGQTLNRVARLLSIGYGGQTLVSLVTAELLRDLLPDDVSLQDLGAHRLKDLLRPESVFQLVRRGLPSDFPALKSLDNHPHNLPLQPTPFVGREKELASSREILAGTPARMVTLTGVGGTGKTRLALQLAAELIDGFPDGVFFVDLSAIDSPAHLIPMIARTLEVRETGARPLESQLQDALHDKRMLLVLDNFEQVMSAVPHVAELLAVCPLLKIIVTSREALHIRAERVLRVPPLTVPRLRDAREMAAARLSQFEAVALFIERAVAVNADFHVTNANAPAVAEICARLDGLPLAIELAAVRMNVFTPEGILERLGNQLKLLSGGAADLPHRQRTLRATIDWSYRMLTPPEQTLFREAAVFLSGCTLDAIEAVCTCRDEEGLDIVQSLASLVDKSLLNADERPAGRRFSMFESLREYGLEVLEKDGATKTLRDAHARYFLTRAEQLRPSLDGPGQKTAFDTLEAEHDNFRGALNQFHEARDAESELHLCAALGLYWQVRGHLTEGMASATRALESARGSRGLTRLVLQVQGTLAREQGDYEQSIRSLEEALREPREGDENRHAAAALNELGMTLHRMGNVEGARSRFEGAYRVDTSVEGVERAVAEKGLGLIAEKQQRLDDAWRHHENARKVFERVGNVRLLARALANLANVSYGRGDAVKAVEICRRALHLGQEVGDEPYVARMLNNLGFLQAARGEHERARECYDALGRVARKTGNVRMLALAHTGSADAALAMGKTQEGLDSARRAFEISNKIGAGMELATSLRALGEAHLARGERREAAACFSRCIPLLEKYIEFYGDNEIQRARKGLAEARGAPTS